MSQSVSAPPTILKQPSAPAPPLPAPAPPPASQPASPAVPAPPGGPIWPNLATAHRQLIESGGIDWLDLKNTVGAEQVKHNAQRSVWRIQRGGADLFVKIYRPSGFGSRLKQWWRGPTAAQEWAVGQYAAAHGVPTVPLVGCGWLATQRRGGPSWLITDTVVDARPLADAWLEVRGQPRAARRLIDVVARLVARAHQSGFHHRDMHAGNILARRGDDGAPEALFVDLHNVVIGRRVPTQTVLANLAQLNQWFRRHATRSERLLFLLRYLKYRDQYATLSRHARNWQADRRTLLADLDRCAALHAERLWAKRDRRAQRDGRYFCRLSPAPGWSGLTVRQSKHPRPGSALAGLTLDRVFWKEALSRPLDWVRGERVRLVKDSHTATVCRGELTVGGQALPVIAKRPLPRTWPKRLAQWLGHSRNRRTWRIANKLIHRDLPTAQPLAVVERRWCGLVPVDGVLLAEFVESDGHLEAFLERRIASLPPHAQRRAKDALIDALVRLLRDFHARGFVHRDFKASNVLVCPPPCGDSAGGRSAEVSSSSEVSPRLVLIDLDGVAHRPRGRRREAALWRAVARLGASLSHVAAVTRTDRARFLRRLLSEPGRDARRWRSVWRDLSVGADRILAHKARRRDWKLKHYGRE